jgi:hypothetical protein
VKPGVPTPWQIVHAVDTLTMAGARFTLEPGHPVRVVSAAAAAEVLDVSVAWVRDHMEEFPGAVRLPGGLVRIPVRDLEALLARNRLPRPVLRQASE